MGGVGGSIGDWGEQAVDVGDWSTQSSVGLSVCTLGVETWMHISLLVGWLVSVPAPRDLLHAT